MLKLLNVPVVANAQGGNDRVIGAADVNYETGEVVMHLGVDTLAVMEGSFGTELHYIGLYTKGRNVSDQPDEMRHGAWLSMLERKEEFELPSKEITDGSENE